MRLAFASSNAEYAKQTLKGRYGGRAERRMKISLTKGIVAIFFRLALTDTDTSMSIGSSRRGYLLQIGL